MSARTTTAKLYMIKDFRKLESSEMRERRQVKQRWQVSSFELAVRLRCTCGGFVITRAAGANNNSSLIAINMTSYRCTLFAFYRRMTHLEQKVFDVSKKFSKRRGVSAAAAGACVTSDGPGRGASHYAAQCVASRAAGALYRMTQTRRRRRRRTHSRVQETGRGFTAAAAAALGCCSLRHR